MKVLLITTGGTIASTDDGSGFAPSLSGAELIKYLPQINKAIQTIDVENAYNIDSLNLHPKYWMIIVNILKEKFMDYDGFIIAHGTDTLGYTSAALSYFVQTNEKPVLITGSQLPINVEGSDAPGNLAYCLELIANGAKGTYAVFDNKFIYGTRARKVKTKSFDAFESVNYAEAGINNEKAPLFSRFYDKIEENVCLIKLTPGLNPDILKYAADNYKAIVVESFGAGGLPVNDYLDYLPYIDYILDKGVYLAIGTQVMYEGSDMFITEVGRDTLIKGKGKILQTLDMNPETALVKLMWILGGNKDFNTVKQLFYTPVNNDICLLDRFWHEIPSNQL